MLANGQFSSFSLGNGRLLLSSSSSPIPPPIHGFPISQKPSFGIALDSWLVKKRCNLDARAAMFRVSSVLADKEAGSSVRLLEKEIKFTPTFSDYVKVMESVKTDRSKNSSGDVDAIGLNKKSNLRDAKTVNEDKSKRKSVRLKRQSCVSGDDENDGNQDVEESIRNKNEIASRRRVNESRGTSRLSKKTNGSGWGLVEGLLEKRAAIRTNADGGCESDGNGRYGDPKDAKKNNFRRKVGGTGRNVGDGLSMNKDTYKRSVGRKMEKDFVERPAGMRISMKNNIMRKSGSRVISNDALKRNSFYGNNTRKKSDGYNIDKNASEDKSFLSRDQIKRHNNVCKTEREVLETKNKYSTQNKHVNEMGGIRAKHISKNYLNSVNGTSEIGIQKQQVNIPGDVTEISKCSSRDADMHAYRQMQSNKVVRSDKIEHNFEDRAAFKSFEIFTDVKNRPRVLRMEMEERINKLAKQLHAKDINIPQWQFSKMMHSAKIRFTDHSILRVVQVLGAFGNWRRVLQVVEWLQTRERFKSLKSRYIYTSVLNVLGKAKRPIEALNVFYAMRQELSSYPDLAAYHCIAVALGQAGLMKELFDVIDCMRTAPEKKFKLGPLQKWDPRVEPDLVIYNSVLNACVQQKHWEGAFWVLQQLKQQSMKPSNTTYGLIMEVMLACGKYNLVHEFFRKVQKTSIPGAMNYKVLVNALWREGKIDEAVLAVKDMERRGIVGSASLYYDLARCLCSAGRCKEALLQIDKICKVASKPLVVTYTGLIQSCIDSGSIENAAVIFSEMHKFCSPNIVCCNIMLNSYIEHGWYEKAKELFHKMLDSSHQIMSKVDLSQKVIPDKFTFNTMIEASAKTSRWDDFENAYRQMLNHGHHFDTRRHLRLVMDAYRAGKVQVLELTWNHLLHFGRDPPPPLIKERFCLKLIEDDLKAAISCLFMVQDVDRNAFSVNSWLNLLYGNSHHIEKDTIVRLDNELKVQMAESGQLHPAYVNLIDACKELVSHVKTKQNFSNVPELLI